MKKEYFHGWYYKVQTDRKTLAAIAASHISGESETCSVQLITDDSTWEAVYPISEYCSHENGRHLEIGGSVFTMDGITLDIDSGGTRIRGSLRFTGLTPIPYDIMGPFALVPFMECRHTIISMCHRVDGELEINGETLCFENALGYIEGDRGSSFPSVYAWTQCCFENGSLFLSVADIPLGKMHFTGIIGIVLIGEKQYRIATYLGAKPVSIRGGTVTVRQGGLTLTASLIRKKAHPLRAPVSGAMKRTIYESASCTAGYKLEKNGEVLLDMTSDRASFEYEYPE